MMDDESAEGILVGVTSATGLESELQKNCSDWQGTEMCFFKR